MIIVKLMGGLGNQMFQYATGRALSVKHKTPLYLDISGYDTMADTDTPRSYELDIYNIDAVVADDIILANIESDLTHYSLSDKFLRRLGRGKVFTIGEHGSGFNENIPGVPNNTYLLGWWQTEKYFSHIRPLLLHEFEPRNTPTANNLAILQQITSSNSVSIHVRRGDYVQNKLSNTYHGLTTVEYYSLAIEYMKKSIPSPRFFVFSDDIDWCKKELPLPKNSMYIEGNTGTNAFEDIRLMKHCRHAVIANSSFSWWGAWLNQNPDKIIIAPKTWFQDKQANDATDIVPSQWVRM